MKKIETIFIKDELIYLKKGYLGWKVVKPWKNLDGTFNWYNILMGGSWIGFLFWVFLILMIIGAIFEYANNLRIATECLKALNDSVIMISWR